MIHEVTVTRIYQVETDRPEFAIAAVVLKEMEELINGDFSALPEAQLIANEPYKVIAKKE